MKSPESFPAGNPKESKTTPFEGGKEHRAENAKQCYEDIDRAIKIASKLDEESGLDTATSMARAQEAIALIGSLFPYAERFAGRIEDEGEYLRAKREGFYDPGHLVYALLEEAYRHFEQAAVLAKDQDKNAMIPDVAAASAALKEAQRLMVAPAYKEEEIIGTSAKEETKNVPALVGLGGPSKGSNSPDKVIDSLLDEFLQRRVERKEMGPDDHDSLEKVRTILRKVQDDPRDERMLQRNAPRKRFVLLSLIDLFEELIFESPESSPQYQIKAAQIQNMAEEVDKKRAVLNGRLAAAEEQLAFLKKKLPENARAEHNARIYEIFRLMRGTLRYAPEDEFERRSSIAGAPPSPTVVVDRPDGLRYRFVA